MGKHDASPPAAPGPPSPDAFAADWDEPDYEAAPAPPPPALSDVSEPGSDDDAGARTNESEEDEVREPWLQYATLVTDGVVLLKRLSDSSWVVQGWDRRKGECTVSLLSMLLLVLHSD